MRKIILILVLAALFPVQSSPAAVTDREVADTLVRQIVDFTRIVIAGSAPDNPGVVYASSPDRRWERLEVESPELYGMNYLMQYDPVRNVFLHFEKSAQSGDRFRVNAFRFR